MQLYLYQAKEKTKSRAETTFVLVGGRVLFTLMPCLSLAAGDWCMGVQVPNHGS